MKFWIDNHGCAKNQVDAEEIAVRMENAGHTWVDSASEADLIVVNTCGFIESAKKESINAIMDLKAAHPETRILVAGCLAQRYAESLASDLAEADGIAGNTDFSSLPRIAEATLAGERPVFWQAAPGSLPGSGQEDPNSLSPSGAGEFRKSSASDTIPDTIIPGSSVAGTVLRRKFLDYPGTAHVKITEGCSNRCSFCAIPLIRGSLRSREIQDILSECRNLTGAGIKELVLIGQDLGSYGKDRAAALRLDAASTSAPGSAGSSSIRFESLLLPELLEHLAHMETASEFRIRVLYIHPDHLPEGLLDVMAENSRILPYFDIPFQHGSEKILKAMNRRGNREKYRTLLSEIRKRFGDQCMLRSTFLTGFPGESEADFAELLAFQKEANLDWVGTFAYSREEGTTAYDLKGRVPKKIAETRRGQIENAQIPITAARLSRFIGTTQDILIEEQIEGEELCIGRGWMQAPDVDGLTVVRGVLQPGTLVRTRIIAVNGVDFEAVPLVPGTGQ